MGSSQTRCPKKKGTSNFTYIIIGAAVVLGLIVVIGVVIAVVHSAKKKQARSGYSAINQG